jgi:hypothetical protein
MFAGVSLAVHLSSHLSFTSTEVSTKFSNLSFPLIIDERISGSRTISLLRPRAVAVSSSPSPTQPPISPPFFLFLSRASAPKRLGAPRAHYASLLVSLCACFVASVLFVCVWTGWMKLEETEFVGLSAATPGLLGAGTIAALHPPPPVEGIRTPHRGRLSCSRVPPNLRLFTVAS